MHQQGVQKSKSTKIITTDYESTAMQNYWTDANNIIMTCKMTPKVIVMNDGETSELLF